MSGIGKGKYTDLGLRRMHSNQIKETGLGGIAALGKRIGRPNKPPINLNTKRTGQRAEESMF